jgi:hypothetical protein
MNHFEILLIAVLMLADIGTAKAQGYFNPDSPADPMMKSKITVRSEPADAGYVSGAGSYTAGTSVWISTSGTSESYEFLYWTLNGEKYSEDSYLSYTSTRENAEFVAVYTYNPRSPNDPTTDHYYRLNLTANPSTACSFNLWSGERYREGNSVSVYAYPNQYYVLKGWYLNGQKVSTNNPYTFVMPTHSVALEAIFEYAFAPANPSDPGDITLGIASIGVEDGAGSRASATSVVYNLAGQRLSADLSNFPKGIYIVNGRKVIFR